MAEVVLDCVGKTYPNGVRAVYDLSLTIADGELIVLVGPSGCGKTTTLRLIAGLETPTVGTMRIAGRVVNGEPPHRRDVAMVFQRPALYPHLNVRQNLGFGLALRQGWWASRTERRGRVEEAARLLRLSDVLDRRPHELSGGQQQRAALGRALVREPAVFLLDEPLSNLDARLRLEMRRELHLLHRRLRATMVYVTHDQEEALTLGDRVVLLDRGEVRQADRPQALYEKPANRAAAAFIGWPPMNFLEGCLIERDGRWLLAQGDAALTLGATTREEWRPFIGREVAVGVRPEHVRATPSGPAELVLLEKTGPHAYATLRYGWWTVTAFWDGPATASEGSPAGWEFALVQAHLFDRRSGQVLSSGRSDGWRR